MEEEGDTAESEDEDDDDDDNEVEEEEESGEGSEGMSDDDGGDIGQKSKNPFAVLQDQ